MLSLSGAVAEVRFEPETPARSVDNAVGQIYLLNTPASKFKYLVRTVIPGQMLYADRYTLSIRANVIVA